MTHVLDSLIVGAGISGLSLAHALHQNPEHQFSLNILVSEHQPRVGGNITTVSEGEFLWEEGPNSFSPTPEFLKLAVDVGLKSELIFADRKLPRYVYWNGQLMPVPMSPPALVSTQLLSSGGKLRALMGALGFVPPAIGQQLSLQNGEETISQFFERHLGSEVLQRLVEPFVSGVYAGDPQQLEIGSAFARVARMAYSGGGLLAGAVLSRRQNKDSQKVADLSIPQTKPGELGSFRQGISALPNAIAKQLGDKLKLNWKLTRLERTENLTYRAEFSTPEGVQQVEAKTVVLTTPAYVTAEILQSLQPQMSQTLTEIPYPPVACVVLAYPVSALKQKLTGFGHLVPRGQGIRTLGTIWTSSLFPGRAPQGWQVLTSYIGGATDPEIGEFEDTEIIEAVHQDLRRIVLQENVPPKVLAVHLWKRAIPQYNLGHQHRLQQVQTGLNALPGLYLCSNYIDGVALGDCVRRSLGRANEIRSFLGK
ncbi:MAG: protoporphyrinogen oxidase [Limnoraphis robusta]|jgi:oxygen-dependent protoporphyrinogen oxidase